MSTKCKECGSYAINPNLYERDGTDLDLCDVHFWMKRAKVAESRLREAEQQEPVAWVAEKANAIPQYFDDERAAHVYCPGYEVSPLFALPKPAPVSVPDGWKEAAIAWEVCASIHREWAKGKDALYTTRQADFVKHAENARAMLAAPTEEKE